MLGRADLLLLHLSYKLTDPIKMPEANAEMRKSGCRIRAFKSSKPVVQRGYIDGPLVDDFSVSIANLAAEIVMTISVSMILLNGPVHRLVRHRRTAIAHK